ncbi:WD40 repeat-like protein [Rhizopogon salebrosus TDB-379]|nr:WD40 repeat-like protein [Rhizopogon salebrosus TDB-379]
MHFGKVRRNEALPPRWQQFEAGGSMGYQDDNLVMISFNRPLPGVRLGRSYFVNHNTRTTSWKKPVSDRPVGSLTPECIIEGHSECIWSLACMGTSCNIMSASSDGSIRQWIRNGAPVGVPWRSDGEVVASMAVCPDETMVVSGGGDGRLQLWNVEEGGVVGDPWEGHGDPVRDLDWSPNAIGLPTRLVSQRQGDSEWITRWHYTTMEPEYWTTNCTTDRDRVASCGSDHVIRVWSLCWSKDGAYIFSGSGDCTIRKWQSIDGKELVVLRGHTNTVRSICLSPDERHLVSASSDCSVRIWDLKRNEQVGDPLLHDDELLALAIPSDGRYIASAGLERKIYVWSFEAALKQGNNQVRIFDVSPLPTRQANNEGLTRHGNKFWSDGTKSTPRRLPPRSGPSPPSRRNFFDFLYFRRPVDASPSIPHQARRWNFSLFTGRIPAHTVDVAPARDEDRYAIAPPTEAEKAAAMQYVTDNEVNGSAHQGGAAAGVQDPQEGPSTQIFQGQNPAAPTEESSDLIVGCCRLFLVYRRSGSH